MEVVRAEVMGLCFGVRDALRVIERVDRPDEVTIHGELVHNEVVLIDLENRGFRRTEESDRLGLPETPRVLITAHGISNQERARLQAAGRTLIDTTCPLVSRAHEAAVGLSREGYHVLLIGRRGHVEVIGIIEDLASHDVVERSEEVTVYPFPRLGVVCQTTTPQSLAEEVHAAIVARNPTAEVRFVDTVCRPTKDHQKALEELLDRVEAVVVVGGKNSNNTRALTERCRARGRRAWQVSGPSEVDPRWFDGMTRVGLTAGTSTLDSTVDDVERAILEATDGPASVIAKETCASGPRILESVGPGSPRGGGRA